jgi:DNA polymerase-3 subunit alpha
LKSLNRKSVESLIKSGAMDAYGDRQAQLDAVEAMLGYARENQKAANSNQSSLFGAATLSRATIRLAEGVTTAKADRLAWEKELLGLYVSEHPWQQWEKLLTGAATSLAEALARPEGAAVTVGGVIVTVKNIQTKKNDTMAFVKLTDMTGSTEAIVFPSVYKLGSAMWAEDRPVIIMGKISSKDGVPKIIVDRAEVVNGQTIARIKQDFGPRTALGAAPLPAEKPVSLIVAKLEPSMVNQLKALLEKHPGPSPVELVYVEGGRSRRVRTSLSVAMNDALRQEIETVLGEGSVK